MQKISLLFALLFGYCLPLLAQNGVPPISLNAQRGDVLRTLRFHHGGDSVRLGITGKGDTFTRQYLSPQQYLVSEEQRVGLQIWQLDSLYLYQENGAVQQKRFGLYPLYARESMDAKDMPNDADSVVTYYTAERVQSIETTRRNDDSSTSTKKIFDPAGALLIMAQGTRRRNTAGLPTTYKYIRNVLGQKTHAMRTLLTQDTVVQIADTLFHSNGVPKLVKHSQVKWGVQEEGILQYAVYSEQGVLLESLPPDSVRLMPFKDNIECLYGFKNKRGDTVIRPRYENIVPLGEARFAATQGNQCRLLRTDGSVVATPFAANIGAMNEQAIGLARIGGFAAQNVDFSGNRSLYLRSGGEEGLEYLRQQRKKIYAYFQYTVGDSVGIIDHNGRIAMPLQRQKDVSPIYRHALDHYLQDNQNVLAEKLDYVRFMELKTTEIAGQPVISGLALIGVLDTNGSTLLDTVFKNIQYAGQKDFFIVSKNACAFNSLPEYAFGLMNAQRELLLPCDFKRIEWVWGTDLFTVRKEYPKGKGIVQTMGLFNAVTRKWLLDMVICEHIEQLNEIMTYINQDIQLSDAVDKNYLLYTAKRSQKRGLLDHNGNVILAAEYDRLTEFSSDRGLFYYQKKEKHGIYDVKAPKAHIANNYTFLHHFVMVAANGLGYETYFVARNAAGKWGIIRGVDEKIIRPFEYEYAGEASKDQLYILVKNGRGVFVYTNYIVSDTILQRFSPLGEPTVERSISTLSPSVIGTDQGAFFLIQSNGKIVLPPGYQSIEDTEHYIVIKNKKGKSQLLLKDNQSIIADTEANRIRHYRGNAPLILLQQYDLLSEVDLRKLIEAKKRLDFAFVAYLRSSGVQVSPSECQGIAIGDIAQSIFFTRKDSTLTYAKLEKLGRLTTPCGDTLYWQDSDWIMRDSLGRVLTPVPFRFPIDFQNGLGVGMQGEKMGIFRTDGTALLAPQAQKIWRDDKTGFFYIYTRQGLSPVISVLGATGKSYIQAATYDAIVPFRGKYTLMRRDNQFGLIDTAGNEIIAPQDLHAYRGSLLDSFVRCLDAADSVNISPLLFLVKLPTKGASYFFNTIVPLCMIDTAHLSPILYATVNNLLLLHSQPYFFTDRATMQLNRVPDEQIKLVSESSHCNNSNFYDHISNEFNSFDDRLLTAYGTYIAFKGLHSKTIGEEFINYHYQNGRWERVIGTDFYTQSTDKRADLYALLVKKIKALKKEIDCSNSSDLLQQAQNTFLIRPEGVDIYLKSNRRSRIFVRLSWAELKGLVKA
jgi:WG containing repeat